MSKAMDGIKLISHTGSHDNIPDDPSYPYRIDINLRPPELMQVTFVMLYGGSEEIVVRAMTKEIALAWLGVNKGLQTHPRLRYITITGPDGVTEEFKREAESNAHVG